MCGELTLHSDAQRGYRTVRLVDPKEHVSEEDLEAIQKFESEIENHAVSPASKELVARYFKAAGARFLFYCLLEALEEKKEAISRPGQRAK
jgi:hypothetical protein